MLVQPTQWPQRPKPGRPPHVVIIVIGATIAETLTGCTPIDALMDWPKLLFVAVFLAAVIVAAKFCSFNRNRSCANCKHCHKYDKQSGTNYRCEKHHLWVNEDNYCSGHIYDEE